MSGLCWRNSSMDKHYTQVNAEIWDSVNECLTDKTTAISHEDYLAAKEGALNIPLAGVRPVPRSWLPPLKDSDVLALACGGGQQAPVFAAHGARVTVTDVSARQLDHERLVAQREGYDIHIIEADMSQTFPFEDASFDLIFNPVSNCYIRDILPMQRECARVLRPGGVLMTAFVKEEHFLFDPDFQREEALISRHPLPFDPLRDLTEAQRRKQLDNRMPLAFSHTLTEQLGGLMQAGFELTDIFEDGDGGGLFDRWMQSYVAIRAVRKG